MKPLALTAFLLGMLAGIGLSIVAGTQVVSAQKTSVETHQVRIAGSGHRDSLGESYTCITSSAGGIVCFKLF